MSWHRQPKVQSREKGGNFFGPIPRGLPHGASRCAPARKRQNPFLFFRLGPRLDAARLGVRQGADRQPVVAHGRKTRVQDLVVHAQQQNHPEMARKAGAQLGFGFAVHMPFPAGLGGVHLRLQAGRTKNKNRIGPGALDTVPEKKVFLGGPDVLQDIQGIEGVKGFPDGPAQHVMHLEIS